MKRFFSVLITLCILSLAIAGACAEAAEEKSFNADGFVIYYEVVPQDQVDQVVGDLAKYVDTEGMDPATTRLLYIHYTRIEVDGENQHMGRVFMNLSWSAFKFTVDGKEYTSDSMLMSSGTQTFLTCLFVPVETPDDAEVSIKY